MQRQFGTLLFPYIALSAALLVGAACLFTVHDARHNAQAAACLLLGLAGVILMLLVATYRKVLITEEALVVKRPWGVEAKIYYEDIERIKSQLFTTTTSINRIPIGEGTRKQVALILKDGREYGLDNTGVDDIDEMIAAINEKLAALPQGAN